MRATGGGRGSRSPRSRIPTRAEVASEVVIEVEIEVEIEVVIEVAIGVARTSVEVFLSE